MNPPSELLPAVRELLAEVLALPNGGAALQPGTPLFGSLPEFDSMSVIHLVTGIERRFGITVEDAEVSAELFETVGSMMTFIARKQAALQPQA